MTFEEVYRNEAGTLSIDKEEPIRVLLRTEVLGIENTLAVPYEAISPLIEALPVGELGEYLSINHPSIIEEYNRYQDRHNPPKVGERIITLQGGFGGPAGVIRTVIEVDEEYITVVNDDNDPFIAPRDVWYKYMRLED